MHTFQLFSALTVLFLFLFLMFFLNTEQGVHIGFDRLQLLIFFSQPFVIFVGGFLLCQQIGILVFFFMADLLMLPGQRVWLS